MPAPKIPNWRPVTIKVRADLAKRTDLTGTDKLLYELLVRLELSETPASTAQLAKRLGVGTATISRGLARLRAAGLIE